MSPCSGRGGNGADRGPVCKELTLAQGRAKDIVTANFTRSGNLGSSHRCLETLDKSRLGSGAQPCLRAERGPQTRCWLGLDALSFHTVGSLAAPSGSRLQGLGQSRKFCAVHTRPWRGRGHQGGLAPVAHWDPSSNWRGSRQCWDQEEPGAQRPGVGTGGQSCKD